MRYQEYIIGRELGPRRYDLRQFSVPVHQVDGKWVPAGEPFEETHLTDHLAMMISVDEFQIHTDNTCGKLDDMPCPAGWKVMTREWLPDDYTPPTQEEVDQRTKDAIDKLRQMGVWRDPS
jgi:hypothetical protein